VAFLLVEQRSGRVPPWADLVRPAHRQSTDLACAAAVEWACAGFRLRLSSPDLGCRLPLAARSNDDKDDELWLALDGYIDLDHRAGADAMSAGRGNPVRLIAQQLVAYGPAALAMLGGAFSLCAVWPQQGRWLLYRDRLGGRSVYHHGDGSSDWRAAASSAAALASLRRYRFAAEPTYLASVLALRAPPPVGHSPFQGIAELPAGAFLEASGDRVRIQPATAQPPPIDIGITAGQALQRFAGTFQQAVRSTIDDALAEGGNVAIMLSGGMDSSPAAAVAAELLSAGGQRLVPVTWSLPGYPGADESAWVELTCHHLGLAPLRFDGSACLPFGYLDATAINPEVPHFNPYRGLMDACYRLAADAGCRIVLNGNAGDLIYPPGSLRLLDMLRRRDWHQLQMALRRLVRQCGVRGALRQPELRHLLSGLLGKWPRQPTPAWLSARGQALLQADAPVPPAFTAHPWPDYAWQLLGPRMAFGRAQENIAANRQGVDRRDPFHDQNLVELMLSLPVDISLGLHQDKRLMRAAMRGRLPDAIRLKGRTGLLHGFMAAGFQRHRQDLRELLAQDDCWQELVDPSVIQAILASDQTTATQQLVVGQCAGMVLWQQYWRG